MAKNDDVTVVGWTSYDDSRPDSILGGMGGWFGFNASENKTYSHRWKDYLDIFVPEAHPRLESLRKAIVDAGVWESGDWHQRANNGEIGCPVFSDGTVGRYSFRAWGDLMAAVWSEYYDRDYCYMDFYYAGTPSKPSADEPECPECGERR